jgi:hypothetical protein
MGLQQGPSAQFIRHSPAFRKAQSVATARAAIFLNSKLFSSLASLAVSVQPTPHVTRDMKTQCWIKFSNRTVFRLSLILQHVADGVLKICQTPWQRLALCGMQFSIAGWAQNTLSEPAGGWPWRWRHYDISEHRSALTRQHNVTSKATRIFSNTAVRTWTLAPKSLLSPFLTYNDLQPSLVLPSSVRSGCCLSLRPLALKMNSVWSGKW